MAYRPVLVVDVEYEGAVFSFTTPDTAWTKLAAFAAQAQQAGGEIDTDDAPPAMLEALVEMFVKGVVAWEGVEAKDGKPLACNEKNRERIPWDDKIAVATAYIHASREAEEGKVGAEERPIDSSASSREAD